MAETTYSDRMRHRPAQRAESFGSQLTTLRNTMSPWWFLLPTLVFFVWYQAYPIIRVLWISFTDYQYLSSEPANFVGFDNYVAALKDPLMWLSLWRATLFTIMFLPGTIILPLLLAILVDRVVNQRLATFYRVVLLIPAVIPSTLVFVLWKWMYNYQVGPINHLLVDVFGLFTLQNAPQWLGGTPLTLPAIAINSRSIPSATPAQSGRPRSSAWRKFSSIGAASNPRSRRHLLSRSKRRRCSAGSVSS